MDGRGFLSRHVTMPPALPWQMACTHALGVMIVFSLARHQQLADALVAAGGVSPGQWTIERFANQELHVTVQTPVAGRDVVVLGAVDPPDVDLLATSLLAHTLTKEGASSVSAWLPYLGYARQDRSEAHRSVAAAWIGTLLRASGIGEVVTIDVHSNRVHDLFPVPVRSLSPATLFAGALRDAPPGTTVVAPDDGAIARAEAVRRAAGIARPLAHFSKTRTADGIRHIALHGDVGAHAVVVDDILDTAATLVSACERLRDAGATELVVCVTHGLFTGSAWRRLPALGVRRLYCTDSVPPPVPLPGVTILSVAALLAHGARNLSHCSH
jgi:ribose-phosphate pyrophosphokinase